jgi:CRISPR-associated protein Cas1
MPNLYIAETGSRIEIEHQRLLVTEDDEVLLRMPLQKIDQIVLIGMIGLTTPAIHKLLQLNIPVTFLSNTGDYIGQITPAFSKNLPLRQMQYKRNDDHAFIYNFSKNIVSGKIHNQHVQTLRWARLKSSITRSELEQLAALEAETEKAANLSALLGIEGSAARIYFNIMEKTIDPVWSFTNRNRRPPKDPVNVLLSFGYTLLMNSICSALQIVGLDPYLGFFHCEDYGRPSLALDLMEEFRVPVVDSLVVSMLSLGQLKTSNFIFSQEDLPVILDQSGKREFIHEFGKKLTSKIKVRGIDRAISYQKHFEVQARKIVSMIKDDSDFYEPFKMR